VRQLRGEHRDSRHVVREPQRPLHAEPFADRRERFGDPVARHAEPVQLPLHSLEEDAFLLVRVLVGVDDVAVVAVQKVGHGGDESFLVAARDE
jgi:hypothetical protein